MNIILVGGKANSGKGTVAKIIEEILNSQGNHVIRCSLSTYIREIAEKDFYWDGIDTVQSRRFMGEVYRVGTDFYPFHMARRVWERDIKPFAKPDSIAIVESFREKVNYDYFEILLKQNQIQSITTVRVVRPNFNAIKDPEHEKHVSESDLDDFPFDYVIDNDGTVKELEEKLGELFDG